MMHFLNSNHIINDKNLSRQVIYKLLTLANRLNARFTLPVGTKKIEILSF